MPELLRDHADILLPLAFLLGWLALQLWILPWLGLPT
jgi:hypothetical protein